MIPTTELLAPDADVYELAELYGIEHNPARAALGRVRERLRTFTLSVALLHSDARTARENFIRTNKGAKKMAKFELNAGFACMHAPTLRPKSDTFVAEMAAAGWASVDEKFVWSRMWEFLDKAARTDPTAVAPEVLLATWSRTETAIRATTTYLGSLGLRGTPAVAPAVVGFLTRVSYRFPDALEHPFFAVWVTHVLRTRRFIDARLARADSRALTAAGTVAELCAGLAECWGEQRLTPVTTADVTELVDPSKTSLAHGLYALAVVAGGALDWADGKPLGGRVTTWHTLWPECTTVVRKRRQVPLAAQVLLTPTTSSALPPVLDAPAYADHQLPPTALAVQAVTVPDQPLDQQAAATARAEQTVALINRHLTRVPGLAEAAGLLTTAGVTATSAA